MKHLRDRFDYDHSEGCLRWRARNDDHVIVKPNGKIETNISAKSRVKAGAIAGKRGLGEYKVKQYGELSCGLRMIWQHVTGEVAMCKIRTMHPRDTKFNIENLYMVNGPTRVHKDRAKGHIVVSFSYERKQYTLVEVDQDYNKTILSYHDDIDSAFEALKEPVVSFL